MAEQRLDDVSPKRDLSLDDIQSEDWVIRTLEKVAKSKYAQVDELLVTELHSIMKECTEGYRSKSGIAVPVVREIEDLVALAEKEARCVTLLARVAEITLSLYRVRKVLSEFWDMCEERINRYPVVYKELTNDRKRTLFYRRVLKPILERQNKLDEVFDTSAKIEEYLKNLHFAIKEMSSMGRDYLMKTTRGDNEQVL